MEMMPGASLQMACGTSNMPHIAALVSRTNMLNYGTLDFGSTTTGTPISRTLVTNQGNATLSITDRQLAPGYSMTPSPLTNLTAGHSGLFTLQFGARHLSFEMTGDRGYGKSHCAQQSGETLRSHRLSGFPTV